MSTTNTSEKASNEIANLTAPALDPDGTQFGAFGESTSKSARADRLSGPAGKLFQPAPAMSARGLQSGGRRESESTKRFGQPGGVLGIRRELTLRSALSSLAAGRATSAPRELRNPNVSIVVAVHNDAATLTELHGRVRRVMEDRYGGTGVEQQSWEAIYVNDGSTDASERILRDLSETDANVSVIHLRRGFGTKAAHEAGMARARGDVIVTLCGDLGYLPEEIPTFLSRIAEGNDIVQGLRDPAVRKASIRGIRRKLMNRVVRGMTGASARITADGFCALRRDCVGRFDLADEWQTTNASAPDGTGPTIAFVPVTGALRRERARGRIEHDRDLFDILMLGPPDRAMNRPGRRPARLGVVFALCALATQIMLGGFYAMGRTPGIFGYTGWVAFSGILDLMAVQFVGIGYVSALISRMARQERRAPFYVIRDMSGPIADSPAIH